VLGSTKPLNNSIARFQVELNSGSTSDRQPVSNVMHHILNLMLRSSYVVIRVSDDYCRGAFRSVDPIQVEPKKYVYY